METTYSKRLQLLRALCEAESQPVGSAQKQPDLSEYEPLDAANYLACYLTFKAIQRADRSPADERVENFDMLSVYQTFAMLVYAYLSLPLAQEEFSPDIEQASLVIVKSLFAGLADDELAEIVEAGTRKFELIANAEQEHWASYRQDLDRAVIAYVIAGTDDEAPFEMEEILPLHAALLSMLCEAFASE